MRNLFAFADEPSNTGSLTSSLWEAGPLTKEVRK